MVIIFVNDKLLRGLISTDFLWCWPGIKKKIGSASCFSQPERRVFIYKLNVCLLVAYLLCVLHLYRLTSVLMNLTEFLILKWMYVLSKVNPSLCQVFNNHDIDLEFIARFTKGHFSQMPCDLPFRCISLIELV